MTFNRRPGPPRSFNNGPRGYGPPNRDSGRGPGGPPFRGPRPFNNFRGNDRPPYPHRPWSPPPQMPVSAREAAMAVISRHVERFPDLEPLEPRVDHLDPRDAALSHAIVDTVVRRWNTLRYVLEEFLDRPLPLLEPDLQAVLLTAAAQILFMDRIPSHAAVDESVELAKRGIREGAGSMANAVLRRIAESKGDALPGPYPLTLRRDALPLADGRILTLKGRPLPEDPILALAIATSHPVAVITQWINLAAKAGTAETDGTSVTAATQLALHSLAEAPTILHTAHLAADLHPDFAVHCTPHDTPGHHVYTGPHALLAETLAKRTDIWAQDPASSASIDQVRHLRPNVILDMCAGQGTKTRQLAAVFPAAKILATDPDPARFATLTKVFAGHDRVTVIPSDTLLPAHAASADLILLDVPCTNSGVLARRAEAKMRLGPEQTERLVQIQRQILTRARALLRASPRGKILYATCSVDPAENREQAEHVSRLHRFRIEHESIRLPQGLPGEPATAYTDGGYSVLLG